MPLQGQCRLHLGATVWYPDAELEWIVTSRRSDRTIFNRPLSLSRTSTFVKETWRLLLCSVFSHLSPGLIHDEKCQQTLARFNVELGGNQRVGLGPLLCNRKLDPETALFSYVSSVPNLTTPNRT